MYCYIVNKTKFLCSEKASASNRIPSCVRVRPVYESREMGAVLVPIPPAVDSLENAFSCTLILGP